MEATKHRIKFALFLQGWSYEHGSPNQLKNEAEPIPPSEYSVDMKGCLFCPSCFTNLTRVPADKNHTIRGKAAYYSHLPTYQGVKCDLRQKRAEGKRYENFEEAQRAIDDGSLVIVSGFLQDKPQKPSNLSEQYNETRIEDLEGPLTNAPISRHIGETFLLPSKTTTVNGICTNFDKNLYRHYLLPHQKLPLPLAHLLLNVEDVTKERDTPGLYYGVIWNSIVPSPNPQSFHIRLTRLKCHPDVPHFSLKVTEQASLEKHIQPQRKSRGRVVLMYGKITKSGYGLCIEGLSWGEFALLPTKYDSFLKA